MNWLKSFWKSLTQPMPTSHVTVGPRGTVTWRSPSASGSGETISNFTPRAQKVLALARQEADRLHHQFVGTEHLLLGLVALGQGTAVNTLGKLGVDLETVRLEVERHVGTGPDQKMLGNIPYTPRVKKVLALAAKEAKALNHTYVGTEHILLGLLREGDGVAARVLRNLEVDAEKTRQAILRELDPNAPVGYVAGPAPSIAGGVSPPHFPRTAVQSFKIQRDVIDTSKRYDVYCAWHREEVMVHRNVLIKTVRKLFEKDSPGALSEFVELEPADGPAVFVARASIFKFSEHLAPPASGDVSGNPA
jgi:hypothetical protein